MELKKIFFGFLGGMAISIIYTLLCHGDTPDGGFFLAYLIGAVMGERFYEEVQE